MTKRTQARLAGPGAAVRDEAPAAAADGRGVARRCGGASVGCPRSVRSLVGLWRCVALAGPDDNDDPRGERIRVSDCVRVCVLCKRACRYTMHNLGPRGMTAQASLEEVVAGLGGEGFGAGRSAWLGRVPVGASPRPHAKPTTRQAAAEGLRGVCKRARVPKGAVAGRTCTTPFVDGVCSWNSERGAARSAISRRTPRMSRFVAFAASSAHTCPRAPPTSPARPSLPAPAASRPAPPARPVQCRPSLPTGPWATSTPSRGGWARARARARSSACVRAQAPTRHRGRMRGARESWP